MEYEAPAGSGNVEIGAVGVAEVLQNVRIILSTIKGSVPLDREFGVSAAFLDQPLPAAKAKLTAEIVEAVERHEPRAKVTSVTWGENPGEAMDGRLFPKVRVYIDV